MKNINLDALTYAGGPANGLMNDSPQEVAWRRGFVDKAQLQVLGYYIGNNI